MTGKRHLALLLALGVGAVALGGLAASCVAGGGEEGEDGLWSAPLMLAPSDIEGVVPEEIWRAAPIGCEGLLSDGSISFSRAENAPGLGVAVDASGAPVCVDSWQDIVAELEKFGGDPSPDPMDPLPE
jgi:hypothetical protein